MSVKIVKRFQQRRKKKKNPEIIKFEYQGN